VRIPATVEAEDWRDLALIALALGTLFDLLFLPLLGVFDVLFLAAALIYVALRRRRESEGP
jgi:hypothetical protein